MKKLTCMLMALVAGFGAMQMSAQVDAVTAEKVKAGMAAKSAAIHPYLPSGYQQLGDTKIYYHIGYHDAANFNYYTIDILGEINGSYYSSTYNDSGYLGAFSVDGGTAEYLDCVNGTTISGVKATASIEPQGEVAARIIYTFTNNNNSEVKISAGTYADVMIGNNDDAPISQLVKSDGSVYGLKMKHSTAEGAPLLCALFGEGITGVVPTDDYWFGYWTTNYYARQIVGNYTSGYNWMQEDGNYDSGMGWCWKERTIAPGETIELSFLISVGEIDFEEPIVPGEDVFTYNVEAYNFEGWNDLAVAHPAHIWGYYEHPYGQEGYIEYQVDDENTWHRIPTALVSGENYDLPFDMFFNQERTTDHVLNLRFTDGMDNYTELNGLTWTDVRSYTVENAIPSFPFDGTPKTFEVIVNGEPVLIGGDAEYVNPGVYTVVVAEGDYDENTIGVLTITFVIDDAVSVEEIAVANENGAWYTIDGKAVAAPSMPGFYIHNGKKYIVK